MYKFMDFDKFFCDENQADILVSERKIAASLISPNQVVQITPIDASIKQHLELTLSIICDIYNIQKPFRGDDRVYICNLMKEVSKHMKEDERNFVIIRYILLRANRIAYVEYPYYITPFEYDSMREIDELFKQYEIETHALIHRFDPINSERLPGNAIPFERSNDESTIKKSLNYIQEHGLISEYELNAPKECILSNK